MSSYSLSLEELLEHFREAFQFLRITEYTQVMQNFDTLDHDSYIVWRSGGICSDAVDAKDNMFKLPLNSWKDTTKLWNHKLFLQNSKE